MAPVTFTRIQNCDGPLSKSFSLKDGRLHKAAAADLVRGRALRTEAADINALARIICNLHPHEAMTSGVTAWKSIGLVTEKRLKKGGLKNTVARTRQFFRYPAGRTALMLDIDKPKDGSAPMKSKDFDALMCSILPWWRACARFYRPSVSAFIYDTDGNELSGPGSLRCYLIADKGANVPYVALAIADALWKAGHGRIEFSADGKALVRCPIDTAVYQPERLDFAGSAVLGAGLTQRRYPPVIVQGGDIDTEAVIAAGPGKMDFAKWAALSPEVKAAKQAARPEEKVRRTRYIETRVADDVAKGSIYERAMRKWELALRTNVLPEDHTIYFRDLGAVRVSDVLRNPDRYDQERCADPHEPTYADDPRIAIFYANRGHGLPAVYSHAHGGHTCLLSKQRLAA